MILFNSFFFVFYCHGLFLLGFLVDGRKKNFFSFYFVLCVADIKKKKKLILCFFKWFMQKNGIKGEASIACARQTDRRWKTLDEKKKCVSIVVRWFIVLNSKYYIGEYVYTPFFLYYYSHHHHRPRVLFLFHEKFNRSCWSFSPPSVDIFSSLEMFQPKVWRANVENSHPVAPSTNRDQ